MTTVETRVVNPVPSRAAVNTVDVVNAEMVNSSLELPEEEKIMVDEEIDSCEAEDLDDQIMSVALANSVADTGGKVGGKRAGSPQPRYGLRKRRRPGDAGSETESSGDVNSSPTVRQGTVVKQEEESQQAVSEQAQTGGSQPSQLSSPPGGTTSSSRTQGTASGDTATGVIGETGGAATTIQPQPGTGDNTASQVEPCVPVKIEPSDQPPSLLPGEDVLQPSDQPAPAPVPAVKSEPTGISASTSIPLQPVKIETPAARPLAPAVKLETPVARPLAPESSAPTLVTSSQRPSILVQHIQSLAKPLRAVSATTPPLICPVPPSIPSKGDGTETNVTKRVTIAEPPVPPTRSRIFSVDLEPFDFSDMVGDNTVVGKSDSGDDPDVTGATPPPDDLAIFKRDRAFSFEFFNFAGEDPLPEPPSASTQTTELPEPGNVDEPASFRPRGDSIIFDPVSFQDGGIHETNALKHVDAANGVEPPLPHLISDSKQPPQPARVQPAPPKPVTSSTPAPPPVYSSVPHEQQNAASHDPLSTQSGQLATLPSALAGCNANGNTPSTFQMELLNKDGRIGIYLPDARKARIARFHAKRKMRIWRKRIKYDCRKKLADSRPRIKGRFVKRSDMDDE